MQTKRTAPPQPGHDQAVKKARMEQPFTSTRSQAPSKQVLVSELNVTAAWRDEPNVAVQEEWMPFIWRIHYRSGELEEVEGSHSNDISPWTFEQFKQIAPRTIKRIAPWTLKQIAHPNAMKILKAAEAQVRSERRRDDGSSGSSYGFDLPKWATYRREWLWASIFDRIRKEITLPAYQLKFLESSSREGWHFNKVREREDIKALLFKDAECLDLQDWIAPFDVCHQLCDALGPLRFNFEYPSAGKQIKEGAPHENNVSKSYEAQKEIDKYFGLFIQHCPLRTSIDQFKERAVYVLERRARRSMKGILESVWKTPEFARLTEEVKEFVELRRLAIEDRRTKGRRVNLTLEINEAYSNLKTLKERLAATYDLPDKFENEESAFWDEWHAKHPEINDVYDYSVSEVSSDSDDSDESDESDDACDCGLIDSE